MSPAASTGRRRPARGLSEDQARLTALPTLVITAGTGLRQCGR